MRRSVSDWEATVCMHRGLPARAGMIALWLARRMKPSRIVSVSEDAIREAFGVSRYTVTTSIKQLKEAGLLVNVVAGRKGMTAVYQGMFPNPGHARVDATSVMTDAARQTLARARANVASVDAQCQDLPDTESTYMRQDVPDAEHALSVRTSLTPRTTQPLTNESDQPRSGQEQAGDDGDDLSWIDDVIRGQDPDEVGHSQGAKRPAPPEAQRKVSPVVKAAHDDWGVYTPVESKSNRSGGRAA